MNLLKRMAERKEKKRKENEERLKADVEWMELLEQRQKTYTEQATKCRENAMNATDATEVARWTQAANYWDDKVFETHRMRLNAFRYSLRD